MPFTSPQGIDFRATSGSATDPANCTYEIGTTFNYPETTPQGNTVGYVALAGGVGNTSTPSTSDRTATDPRLAGDSYTTNANIGYKMAVPSGQYSINMAFGDVAAGCDATSFCYIYDGADTSGTLLQTVAFHQATSAGQFYDATGTLRTSQAAWITANPQGGGGAGALTVTASSGFLLFYWGNTTNYVFVAHIWVQSAAPTSHERVIPILGGMIGWRATLLGSPLPLLGGAAAKLGSAIRRNATLSRRSFLIGHNGGPKLDD
jgi:hypothetical protein